MTEQQQLDFDFDVIIIGAGISGISAAYHLQETCPNQSFLLLERRAQLGGTWDFFRYPGCRSDSDMYTFGFGFRPWSHPSALIADKASILEYLHDTAVAYGIDQKIQYQTHVHQGAWSSETAKWTLTGKRQDKPFSLQARFVLLCSGYYNYGKGYTPEFVGMDKFKGPIVHPQEWPANSTTSNEQQKGNNNSNSNNTNSCFYTNKRVVVIGSGATAVTLIPALTTGPQAAAHVVMLQRSPTFLIAEASTKSWLMRTVDRVLGHSVARWVQIFHSMFIYLFCQAFPQTATKGLIQDARKAVGDDKFNEQDYTPRYKPWDQRLCLCPDGDFFAAIKSGKASIVTDRIVEFTETGLRLEKAQEELGADVIVTATGLRMLFGGGIQFRVDDNPPLNPSSEFVYKGCAITGLPNTFIAAGYTNASWTLKVELTNKYAASVISHMNKKGYRYCQPVVPKESSMKPVPLLDLTSGYVQRALNLLPRQLSKSPWKLYQNYLYDKYMLEYGTLEDKNMKFYR